MTIQNNFPGTVDCWWVDMPETAYEKALALQQAIVSARISGQLNVDVILCLEHPRVFTLGRRGGQENICVSDEFLAENGVTVVSTGRGGNVTYHGPGQMVVYPIVSLIQNRLPVVTFVEGLETAMIRTATHWGITAGTDAANRGVWLGGDKLGSIGLTVRRGVSFHGLALNINTDMEPFGWITPCGLSHVRMTSFEHHLNRSVSMDEARAIMAGSLASIFGFSLSRKTEQQLKQAIGFTDKY